MGRQHPVGFQSVSGNCGEDQDKREPCLPLGYGKGATPDAVNRYCKAVQQTLTKDELALRVYLANYLWYWQSFTSHPDFAHAAKQFHKAEAYGRGFSRYSRHDEKDNRTCAVDYEPLSR